MAANVVARATILWVLSALLGTTAASGQGVRIVADAWLGAPVQFGLDELRSALRERGVTVSDSGEFLVVAGLPGGESLAGLEVPRLPDRPEALAIRRTEVSGKRAVALSGSDERGLMYALLDVAARVRWGEGAADVFAHVRDTVEEPYIRERAVSIYTMQRVYCEQRLFDEEYWARYCQLLARSRINSFVVVFGYENGGFMAPLYPYFFDVEGFPGVELVGITREKRARNVAALRRVIEIAHEHGVDFIPAPWDHIYRGGVQGGGILGASELAGQKAPGLVTGVTSENVAAYNKAAIAKFLKVFPRIDGVQFRMHGESGLKPDEMAGFWHEVFTMIKAERPNLRVDLRAKELPDVIIDDAVNLGLHVRVTTKYWMEQQGLPFHPTHINRQNQHDRRHGYADLLKYPQKYKVHWRLWNGGTTRLLLWADPRYVRRFSESVKVYGGDSCEVNEMLATKMLGEPHGTNPFAIHTPAYRHYEYEFERYWHYYQVWGRVSYNPDVPAETWSREFARRFGEAGKSLSDGLHLASKVLPRIVASSYRYQRFPTTRGWAEMMRMGDLPTYADEQGSDIQQFMNVADAARRLLDGTDTALRRPAENSAWFARTARRILDLVSKAEAAAGKRPSRELQTTVVDLKILAAVARYHSHRLHAGVQYNLYKQTGDAAALDRAIRREEQAVRAWEHTVVAAGDVYSPDLAFGVRRVGFPRHWEEELELLREGLQALTAERRQLRRPWSGSVAPVISHAPVRRLGAGEELHVQATVSASAPPERVVVWLAENAGAFRAVEMSANEEGMYSTRLSHSVSEGTLRYLIEATGDDGSRSVYPASGEAKPVAVIVTSDNSPPEADVDRVSGVRPGQAVKVTAEVRDSSGVKWVRLRYRHLTQMEDYRSAEMKLEAASGRYQAEIPGDFVVPEWDLMYFVEAIDQKGNGRMYPDVETEMPYVILELER